MASPSPSNIDQSTGKRGSSMIRVEEELVKKSKTGEDGVESSFRQKVRASRYSKGAPRGRSRKSVPLTRVCKVSSSGNPSIHQKKNVTVVLSDDDSENDQLSVSDTEVEGSGEGGGGGERNQSEVSTNDGKGYLASLESDPAENIERNPPLNQGLVGGSMSTFPGASSDLLAALATLATLDSPSFSSLTVDQMLQVVPPYGPAMYSSLKHFAENQKLLEAAIFQKEMEEFRTQLQGEHHRSRELEKHLNEAKAEQAKGQSFGGAGRQLKQNEALLNTKLSDAAVAELTRQLDEAKKKHIMELTDWIKEGIKAYIDEWRHKKAAENAGSGSANLET